MYVLFLVKLRFFCIKICHMCPFMKFKNRLHVYKVYDMHLCRLSIKIYFFLLTNQRRPKYSEIHHISNKNQIQIIFNTPVLDKTD